MIVGGEDVSAHKPDPSGLLAAVRAFGGACSHSLYVGDSSTDAETAKAAGVPFLAVLSGTTPREELQDSGAVGILEDLRQLPGVLGD